MTLTLPDRYESEVTVEVYNNSRDITYHQFSDMQIAYMWIECVCKPDLSFIRTCDYLDAAFREKGEGTRVRVYQVIGDTFHINIYYGNFNSRQQVTQCRRRITRR
jgi:hypothetical protein